MARGRGKHLHRARSTCPMKAIADKSIDQSPKEEEEEEEEEEKKATALLDLYATPRPAPASSAPPKSRVARPMMEMEMEEQLQMRAPSEEISAAVDIRMQTPDRAPDDHPHRTASSVYAISDQRERER